MCIKTFKTIFVAFQIVLVVCSFSSYAQISSDSLKKVLDKKTDKEKIEFLNNLAEKNIKTSPDLSIDYAKQSLEISRKVNNQNGELSSLLVLGKALKAYGKYSESIICIQQASDIYLTAKHNDGVAYCYGEKGAIYKEQRKYDNAVEELLKALKIYQDLKDNTNAKVILNNIGNIYFTKQDYKKAIEYYNKVLAQIEKSGDNKEIATVNKQIGGSYANWGNYDDALKYFEKAKKIAETNNYTQLLASISKNINDLQSNISNKEKFKTSFDKEQSNKQEQYVSSLETENMSVKNENLKSFEEIEKLSFENQSKELKLLVIQENLEKQELENKNKEQNIILLDSKNKLAKAELSKEQDKLKSQKKILIIILTAFGVVVLLLIFIFRLFLYKKKSLVLLENQNKEILLQKEEIVTINKELEYRNLLIIDSINYAKRIQNALLPGDEYISNQLKISGFNDAKFFILFKPKDIVSGDFYWVAKTGDYLFFALADCTGHGVPGAFMSLIGMSLLNEIVKVKNILEPTEILDELNISIINSLNQVFGSSDDNNEKVIDGMEIALCRMERNSNEISMAIAGQTALIINNDTVKEVDGTFYGVGDQIIIKRNLKYKKQIVTLNKNDTIYLFSDGFSDQFGGLENQKYSPKKLKNLLLSINYKPLEEQKEILNTSVNEWMSFSSSQKHQGQTDDITVIGLKI